MSRPDELLDGAARSLSEGLAEGMTRRSFLARLGTAVMAATGGTAVAAAVAPDTAEAFHFCGHIYTTGSCPTPYRLPRIDRLGFPIHPATGQAIDNLGRLVDVEGYPVDSAGQRLVGPDGRGLEPAPRTRICEDWVPERFRIEARTQGSWYRCCKGQIRKLVDCCSTSRRRVNGDAALRGYCRKPRNVFCVMYYDTGLPC